MVAVTKSTRTEAWVEGRLRHVLRRRRRDGQLFVGGLRLPTNNNITKRIVAPLAVKPCASPHVPWSTPQGLWTAFLQNVQRHRPQLTRAHIPAVVRPVTHTVRTVSTGQNQISGTWVVVEIASTILINQAVAQPTAPARYIERRLVHYVSAAGTKVFSSVLLPVMSKRGALDSFFKPATPKKPKYETGMEKTHHASYPFAIPHLPPPFIAQLHISPAEEGKQINDQPDLDLVYYQPYVAPSIAGGIFDFLRQELFFYRVQYKIKRGGIETMINTPRFTTVFGVDATSRFTDSGELVDAKTSRKVETGRYKCTPRPLPNCLDQLRRITEGSTGEAFNFCLVNYYADGNDSISYHSDDERFLGPSPAVASFSFGAKRDFLMKHKPVAPLAGQPAPEFRQIKLPLGSGDMVLMRGNTQSNWLHGILKRAGVDASKGRINITFRKALVKGGTENYYQYNVGSGGVYKWDDKQGKMSSWSANGAANGA